MRICPTPIFPAAGLFFAVPIPAGVHVIDIVYEARGLELGVGLAGVWILASGALWWRARKGSG